MITVPNYDLLNQLPNTPDEGEIAVISDSGKVYKYTAEAGWQLSTSSELTINLYDINKQAISQLPTLSANEIEKAKTTINDFIKATNQTYYMLYDADENYFTVFKIVNNNLEHLSDIMIECLQALGEIKSIDCVEGNSGIECWITSTTACSVAYLFGYDGGVVECQK